jgi:hypothetical protein
MSFEAIDRDVISIFNMAINKSPVKGTLFGFPIEITEPDCGQSLMSTPLEPIFQSKTHGTPVHSQGVLRLGGLAAA